MRPPTDTEASRLTAQECTELEHLRAVDPARAAAESERRPISFGQRVADRLAEEVGSWRFVLAQSIVFAGWILANVVGWSVGWDPSSC
jgi:uncharacterized membrane protein